jgi:hypothetical protein
VRVVGTGFSGVTAVRFGLATGDKHITIVLAPVDAKEPDETIDLWLAESEEPSGRLKIVEGQLRYTLGASGNLKSSLVNQDNSVSSDWEAVAGEIRGPELKAGIVPHVLTLTAKEAKNSYVYPPSWGDGTSTDPNAPPTGQRFYLDYTDAEVEALGFKPWKVAVLKALAHYGFYLGDTGNNTNSFRWEGSRMYEPFGAPEPFAKIGEEQGLPRSGSEYLFDLYDGADWTRLRALAPPT